MQVDGAIVGTWRRADDLLTIEPWLPVSPSQRDAVEAEAATLPFPAVAGRIRVRWSG